MGDTEEVSVELDEATSTCSNTVLGMSDKLSLGVVTRSFFSIESHVSSIESVAGISLAVGF